MRSAFARGHASGHLGGVVSNPRLQDRVLVVVGGTTGLGRAAAAAFLREGGRAVVVGRDPASAADAERSLGPNARALAADAADPETAPRAIALARAAFGGFHGLYHVAGGSGRRMGDGPLHEITDDGWRATLDLNLTTLFYSNRAAIRAFLDANTPGAILNMASVLAYDPSPAFFSTHAYAAAKAAILGLTRAAASAYATHGIRVNAVAPALVETPMARRAAGDAAILSFIRTKQPLDGGRIGRATDLDGAAVFLLSDESKFVTGQILAVDGGWTVSDGQIPHSPTTNPPPTETRSP